jgi:Protein of unknown function (DUF3515)
VDAETGDGPPRALMIAAIVVAAGAIIGILVFAALRQAPPEQRPVAIASVPAPKADSAECRALLDALPDELGDYRRAAAADPTPAGAAAWQTTPDGEPVILRCGLDRPGEFVVGSPVQVVDAVQWFRVGEAGAGSEPASDQGRSTWFAIDRPVYVALTLPQGSGPTPIQTISEVIAKSLPTKPIDPAPVR